MKRTEAAQLAFNYLYTMADQPGMAYEVKAALLLGTWRDVEAICKKAKELEKADKVKE